MRVRAAEGTDADEVVRLAALMFESMSMDTSGEAWRAEARSHVAERLGGDLAIFVVDHPDDERRLAAVAAGTRAAAAVRRPGPPG